MNNDIETIINDNIALKKIVQANKMQLQRVEKEKQVIKEEKDELFDQFKRLKNSNQTLQYKYKNLMAENQKNATSFVSQIEELKGLVEEKEQELENIQLKLIPSLDQDMLRVKLIAQMQGPYQQVVDKKDRQILKLKNKIHDVERKNEMLQFSIRNKEKEAKRQIQDSKYFYESEIERLMKQITHLTAKEESRSYDNELVKTYRRQIQQLRSSIEFYQQQEEHSKIEMEMLKTEKEKLLRDLADTNVQKALEIHQSNNENEVGLLKKERYRLEEELSRCKQMNERLENKVRMLESEKYKHENKFNENIIQIKNNYEKEKENNRNQLLDLKEENRRLKDIKNRQQEDYLRVCEKYKVMEKEYEHIKDDNRNIKQKISVLQLQSSRINNSRIERERQFSSRKEKESHRERQVQKQKYLIMEKQIRQKILKQIKYQQSPRKDDDSRQPNKNNKNKNQQYVKILQGKVEKLTLRLDQANRKIIELIQQKAKWKTTQQPEYQQTIPHQDHFIPLQNRDCGLVPLCPPTIYTITSSTRRRSYV